jgi:hypothetical protein
MALTPESRPAWQSWGNLRPASDIQPMVGVYYDAAGNPHQAYVAAYQNAAGQSAMAPGSVAPSAFAAVTPSDSTVLPVGMQSLWVGGAGNLVVKGLDGVTATFTAVPAGTLVRGQFTRVMAATTATNIVAMT